MAQDNTPLVVCLTPTRNDSWVLDRFLKAASLWADYIIIADQMSTDGSREIVSRYPKAILVDNDSEVYNELGRKRLLVDTARKIPGDKILIALDVDEMFSPEIFTSGEWEKVKQLPRGTVIDFQWANFTADAQGMWYGYYFPWGYVDDGFEEYDKEVPDSAIHCARVPIKDGMPHYSVQSFKVIHFQYTDWNRMQHKHYMYQCQEVLSNPGKSAVGIYRQYHHMDTIGSSDVVEIPANWIVDYNRLGIDILRVEKEKSYWYDQEIIKLFLKYGVEKFRKICIWDYGWKELAKTFGPKEASNGIFDPRSLKDRLAQKWMKWSQNKLGKKCIRRIDWIVDRCYGIV